MVKFGKGNLIVVSHMASGEMDTLSVSNRYVAENNEEYVFARTTKGFPHEYVFEFRDNFLYYKDDCYEVVGVR